MMETAPAPTNREFERHAMVEEQLARRGITDARVLDAMRQVPRHAFVPAPMQYAAYADRALPIGHSQTISQPYIVARSCELAELTPGDRVLEVGAGSGYQAAVLGRLVREVIAVELVSELAERARETLATLGVENVTVVDGDGSLGRPRDAPFDAIVVAAGAPVVPEALVEQLAQAGRLVMPVGTSTLQVLTVLRRSADGLERREHDACVFVPLRGAGGQRPR